MCSHISFLLKLFKSNLFFSYCLKLNFFKQSIIYLELSLENKFYFILNYRFSSCQQVPADFTKIEAIISSDLEFSFKSWQEGQTIQYNKTFGCSQCFNRRKLGLSSKIIDSRVHVQLYVSEQIYNFKFNSDHLQVVISYICSIFPLGWKSYDLSR
ncbi:Hypothetical_protein [Hexamita inflata]|uniref:Hypothetical_protein n=1 Tax=Hexamita inflata TaxID=28002 RepID=A0AA86P2P8_9EUKA|nr:Hypothetical protein HINF_LOCUS18171 [Hexamita inflata]